MNGTTAAPHLRGVGRLRAVLALPGLCRLVWRGFRDRRVAAWPKALLVAALLYVVLPSDVVPDPIPLLGQIDDLTVLVLAARWFLDRCPPEVLRDHGARRPVGAA